MTARPTFTQLADYVDGRLDPVAAAAIDELLANGDNETLGAVGWLRSFGSVAGQMSLEAPPVRVRYYLQRQFERRAAGAPAAGAGLSRRLRATLVFDSRRQTAAVGVRSGPPTTGTVHLAFRCEAADVLVDLSAAADGDQRVDGQVLWADGADASVLGATISGPGFTDSAAPGDDLGRFSFVGVPADTNQLVVHGEDVDIRVTWEADPTR